MVADPSKILVTGGAGFIGSHVVDHLLRTYPGAALRILDNFTYAADRRYLDVAVGSGRATIIRGDICQPQVARSAANGVDLIVHLAAESHVDHSFNEPDRFSRTNVIGTQTLLEAMRQQKVPRFIHISTDEVYGDEAINPCDEAADFLPTNPYAASKAAAEMLIRGYRRSFDLDITILRPNNIIGTRQYPEKLIPRFIALSSLARPLTIHGSGHQTRSFLAVADFCRALTAIIDRGGENETYNISSDNEHSVLEIARLIKSHLPGHGIDLVYEQGRPVNDERYHINGTRLAALGWQPTLTLKDVLPEIIDWYLNHPDKLAIVGLPLRSPDEITKLPSPGALFVARPYLPVELRS